jgi:hypothetical protein
MPASETRQARRCAALLSHTLNDTTLARYRALAGALPDGFDVVLLLTDQLGEAVRACGLDGEAVVLDPADVFLPDYGAKAASGQVRPGNTDLVMLAFWRRRPWYDRIWMVEYDVLFPAGPEVLARLDTASEADLIVAQKLGRRPVGEDRLRWRAFTVAPGARERATADTCRHSLFCESRYGARLFPALDQAYRQGWSGHHEATVPSIALCDGLQVDHLNAVAQRALGRPVLSRDRSFRVERCDADDPAFIYHPVKTERAAEELLRALRGGGGEGAPGGPGPGWGAFAEVP